MSKGYVPYLACDGHRYRKRADGCHGTFEGDVHQKIAALREVAKKAGWRSRGRFDICPGCQKNGIGI